MRLRRAAKGSTPFKLLELEEAMQARQLQNAVMKAKRASVQDYQPFYGSDEEDEPKSGSTPGATTPGATPEVEKPSDTEIDAMEQYERQEKEMKKNQVLRAILGGFNFTLKLEGIRVRLFGATQIRRQN